MFGQYDERTQAWADKIGQADGYVIITPEYNHGYPGVLKNAIDHLFREWNHKPVSFVGYGGPGGGLRAVEQLRQVVVELEMVPLRQQVSIPAVYAAFDQSGALANPDAYNAQAMTVLDELSRWAGALRQVRSAVVA
jgi:NAD(P)H-dependent FMN reductase